MASKRSFALALAAGALLTGCVSVENRNGLTPPSALCSMIKGTVGVPNAPVRVGDLKSSHASATVHLHEWAFTGASAGLIDMALQNALANGELKKMYYADYEQFSILGFVTLFNVTAYGE